MFVLLVVVVAVFLNAVFLRFQATFPCHQYSTMPSQAREDLHRLWTVSWLLSVALLSPRLFRHNFTASATALSGHFLPTGVFYLPLLPHIFDTLCDSDSCRNTPSRSSFVPALTELSLPVGTWTWTTHIVFTRLLIYQLRQWATKYRVKIKLLNMFRLFKIIRKDYQNTLNKTW